MRIDAIRGLLRTQELVPLAYVRQEVIVPEAVFKHREGGSWTPAPAERVSALAHTPPPHVTEGRATVFKSPVAIFRAFWYAALQEPPSRFLDKQGKLATLLALTAAGTGAYHVVRSGTGVCKGCSCAGMLH